MNQGLKIKLTSGDKTKEWLSKNGIKDYLDERVATLKATPLNKKNCHYVSSNLELALCFADVEGSQVEFYTNTVRNAEEGVHADDVYKALYDSLKIYVGKQKFNPTDVRDGLIGIVNYKIDAPQFDSQTKEKLVDGRVKGACYKESLSVFQSFWKQNPSFAKDVVKRASELRAKTSEFLKDKKLIKNVNAARREISTKLAGVIGSAPVERRELYLVEGDSAGGGCAKFDTKVRLSDGSIKTMAQLVADDSIGVTNKGLAFDIKNQKVVTFNIDAPRVTRMVTEMVKLNFDNGKEEEFTPDHLFLLKTGLYKKAIDLSEEDDVQEG